MKRIDRWFAADADLTRWEVAAWYSLILSAVAWPSVWAVLGLALVAAVLVVLGTTRWDDDGDPFYALDEDDPGW